MGQTFELQEGGQRRSTAPSEDLDVPSAPDPTMRDRETEKAAMLTYREELKLYRHQLTELGDTPTTEVMAKLSSIAARLAEIRSDLWDMRSQSAQTLRTRHVDPLRADLEFHFKAHSRRIADLQLEWDMARGQ